MRLINTKTLELHEFFNENTPPYAILSHAWGDQEVTFQDWQNHQQASWKHGHSKILTACDKAREYSLEWLWVDTNCIDKSSSTELTEAINSMFTYYQKSKVCFAYLSDVTTLSKSKGVLYSQIEKSRWFTRGWTLQELLASKNLIFYAANWSRIGRKDKSIVSLISSITKIDKIYLMSVEMIHEAPVAKRMSWLAKRTTTRTEDMAYCMLGIFDISMPLLYGEGKRAFFRLQEEIIKRVNDHTIFCWEWNDDVPSNWASLLAPWPTVFEGAGEFEAFEGDEISIFSMTNAGLSIRLPAIPTFGATSTTSASWFARLQATSGSLGLSPSEVACIRVVGRRAGDLLYVSRSPSPPRPVFISTAPPWASNKEPLLVMNKLANGESLQSPEKKTESSTSKTLEFFFVYDSLFSQIDWYCAASYGCDSLLSLKEGRIAFRLDGETPDWAVMLVGETTCILLGARTNHGLSDIAIQLIPSRGGDSRLSKAEIDGTFSKWKLDLIANHYTGFGLGLQRRFGIDLFIERSPDVIKGTYNSYVLCICKAQTKKSRKFLNF